VISIIVPVKNGLNYTRGFVESVRDTNPGLPIEWVVVDSGSTDGTLEYCASIGARVVPFRSDPFNYCAAVNAGAGVACGELWVIANNDLEFRSAGDLARVERLFREWPLLGAMSPGRPEGTAELEFSYDRINGATWVVRPEAFREWGGMPEAMSGYGYDEAYTAFQCWRHGYAFALLTGWDVFHYGSVTFGPEAGNVTPALRRNFSRLLQVMDASDLDTREHPEPILRRLYARELSRIPARLDISELPDSARWRERQGYANARAADASGAAYVLGTPTSRERCQWLPWLANELLLQPEALVVGGEGWYAVRSRGDLQGHSPAERERLLARARSIGPPPPPLMPLLPVKRPTLRQRISALLHSWRQRDRQLPKEW
jgi:GT2 family glycosyltransferase